MVLIILESAAALSLFVFAGQMENGDGAEGSRLRAIQLLSTIKDALLQHNKRPLPPTWSVVLPERLNTDVRRVGRSLWLAILGTG